jgi:hypothetical protein
MRPPLRSRDSDPQQTVTGLEGHSSPQGREVPAQYNDKVSLLSSLGEEVTQL